MKRRAETDVYSALVWALFLALASALCFIVHWRYAIFRNDVDLGIFTQVIAGLGHGFSSTAEGGVNHLLVHWSPIVATAWPFVRAFGPVGLEYFQAILVAAVIFPIWGLARARLRPAPALAFVAVAALYLNSVGKRRRGFSRDGLRAAPLRHAGLRPGPAPLVDEHRDGPAPGLHEGDQLVVLAVNGLLFAVTARSDVRAARIGWSISGLAIVVAFAYFGVVRQALNSHVPYQSFNSSTGPVLTAECRVSRGSCCFHA